MAEREAQDKMQLKMDAAELQAFADEIFPQVRGDFVIEELAPGRAVVRLIAAERHLRPGGTVSGPAMFALADCAASSMAVMTASSSVCSASL